MQARVTDTKKIGPLTVEVAVADATTVWYFRALTRRGALRKARNYLKYHEWIEDVHINEGGSE